MYENLNEQIYIYIQRDEVIQSQIEDYMRINLLKAGQKLDKEKDNFDKALAGIFFACFSIGSFPGTLFNSVIGPAFIKQKISISRKVKNYSSFLFVLSISTV